MSETKISFFQQALLICLLSSLQNQIEHGYLDCNIIEELDNKRNVAINKKKRAILKDETWKYSEEENTIDYVLFLINEGLILKFLAVKIRKR